MKKKYVFGILAIISILINSSFALGITLTDAQLEIGDVEGGILSVIVNVKNIGNVPAEEVAITTVVTGGIINRINLIHECTGCDICGTTLDPGLTKTENTKEAGILIGFGNINIKVTALAKNAEEVSKDVTGIILGPLVIIK